MQQSQLHGTKLNIQPPQPWESAQGDVSCIRNTAALIYTTRSALTCSLNTSQFELRMKLCRKMKNQWMDVCFIQALMIWVSILQDSCAELLPESTGHSVMSHQPQRHPHWLNVFVCAGNKKERFVFSS